MHSPDKRRGGSHVLRTGPTRHGHGTASATTGSSTGGGGSNNNSGNKSDGDALPAPPPKAAMASGGMSPDEAHDGVASTCGPAAPSTMPPSERRDKDKDREAGGPSGPNTGNHHGPSAAARDRQQREREALLQQQVHERDERLARLEADKAAAEREFRREVEALGRAESETAAFWQAKHSALNRQFLEADTSVRLLRADAERLAGERDELLRGWEALRRELRQRDDETRRQRLQIRGLKDWVSTSTRSDGQTSDEVFADSLARLANGLQNWVIVHFRRAKLDLSNVDEATLAELGELVPLYRDLANTAKIHMLQAVVSKILVDMVFSAYFVGLSDEQTQHFTQMEKLLSSFAASDEAVNQWRSSTLALVRRDAAQLLQAETGAVVESVVARVNRILDAMTAQHSPGDARDSALRALVNSSIELARLLVVQRAVLRVHVPEVLPHQRVRFEPDTMEDVGGLEDHALTEREIDCVVFPGVIKHGDESGGQMQFRNVIAKARVLCKPGD